MDVSQENVILIVGCLMHKLKHFIVYTLHLVIELLQFVKKCLQFADQQGLRFRKTIRSSPHLLSLLLCCFILCLPFSCIFIGLSISTYLSPNTFIFPSKDVVVDPSSLNYTYFNSQNLSIMLAGRLGNQMFQYAALYGISTANGFKPVLLANNTLTQGFGGLKCAVWSGGGTQATFMERYSNTFDSHAFMLNFMKPITLTGFFQSWRYFDHVRTEVRQQFSSFRGASDVEAFLETTTKAFEKKLPGNGKVVRVGMHVRRGDFTDPLNFHKGYSISDKYYFKRAMQVFSRKFPRVVFIGCSDDVEWVRTNIKHQALVLSPFSAPLNDLKLLASCDHSIISGGSFGWWGAWLADGITIYPQTFPRLNSPLAAQFKLSDYYLPQWMSL